MKKTAGLILILNLIIFSPSVTFAASPWTEGTTYADKALGKLEFGIINLLGGWTEFFLGSEKLHDQGENAFRAIAVSSYHAGVYTIGGALNAVTFFAPFDIPLPNNGVDLD